MNASFPYVLVTDRTIYPEPLIPYLKKRIPDLSPFPSALILREKDLSKEAYEDLFKETAHLCKAWKLPLLAHNHPDLALDDAIAGVHILSEVETALQSGASYLIVSPLFPTSCKPNNLPLGLTPLPNFIHSSPLPIYVLGGLSWGDPRASLLVALGVRGAVIRSAIV